MSNQDDNEFEPTGEHSYEELDSVEGLTEEALRAELNTYARALESEFRTAAENVVDGDTKLIEHETRTFFKRQTAGAAAQVAWLATNATSESVKLSACKFLITEAFAAAAADADPISDLINKLRQTPESVNGDR